MIVDIYEFGQYLLIVTISISIDSLVTIHSQKSNESDILARTGSELPKGVSQLKGHSILIIAIIVKDDVTNSQVIVSLATIHGKKLNEFNILARTGLEWPKGVCRYKGLSIDIIATIAKAVFRILHRGPKKAVLVIPQLTTAKDSTLNYVSKMLYKFHPGGIGLTTEFGSCLASTPSTSISFATFVTTYANQARFGFECVLSKLQIGSLKSGARKNKLLFFVPKNQYLLYYSIGRIQRLDT